MPSANAPLNPALVALHQAALDISSQVELEKTLQQIVDSARELAGARYAALGVPGPAGPLEFFIVSGLSSEAEAQIGQRPQGRGLLGLLLELPDALRVRDIASHPRSVGFPPGHPPMETFLGIPIRAGDDILGNLYLTDKIDADEFSAADQELVGMLAAHAAVAIQNAKLYEHVGRLAVVEERARLGMDLHDGVIQSIYAVGLMLESGRSVIGSQPQEAERLLDHAIEALNDAIRDIRNFIMDLRPRQFKGDLERGLTRLVREFQANATTPASLEARPELMAQVGARQAQAIFFTVQEALANIARHAHAGQVRLELKQDGAGILLCIADDGDGFDPTQQSQSVGHGLANMRARAEALGGTFAVESAPGAGTTLYLTLSTASDTASVA